MTEPKTKMRFIRKGNLAIEPKAMDVEWCFESAPQAAFEMIGDIALVTIRGPLSHHPEWLFESYDEIVQRVRAAHASEAKAVVISGDTPGGDVSGCFDTSRTMRRIADESGKPTVWYVDGQTCSAGLALAMACDVVVVPEEGRFGSIGVIAELQSFSEQAKRAGVETRIITSGARKADGHPLAEITGETVAAIQDSVDYEAAIFWAWVSERTSIPVETIAGWEAGIFHGQQAVEVGLADDVGTEIWVLTTVASDLEEKEAPDGAERADTMPGLLNKQGSTAATSADSDFDAIRKKLAKMAGDDSDEGRKARKLLDAMDEDNPEKPEDKPEHEEPDGDEGSDESDDASAADETDEDDASTSGASSAEDMDDAKRAESEETDAKRCEDDARKALAEADDEEAKARSALRSGAKTAASDGDRHLTKASRARNRARQLRAEAKHHRSMAGLYRSNAAVHARLNAAVAAPKKPTRNDPRAAAAAAVAKGARGVPAKKPSASALDGVPRDMLIAAGAVRPDMQPIMDPESLEEGLGLVTPEQAKAELAKLNARVAALTEGKS